jgi:GNAT superfamily N-acetyltransferase
VLTALTIGVATADDVKPWLALLDESSRWLASRGREEQWGSTLFSEQPRFIALLREWIRAGGGRIARLKGQPVGAMALGSAPSHAPVAEIPESYLKALVTARQHAGHGIGRALIEDAAGELSNAGGGQLRLDCWAGGDGALVGYYEQLGFQRSGEVMNGSWRGTYLVRPVPARRGNENASGQSATVTCTCRSQAPGRGPNS